MGDASLKYLVEVEIARTGDLLNGSGLRSLTSEAEKATSVAKTLASGYVEVGRNIAEAFTSGMDAAVKYGSVAATAGFGVITHQAMQLNSTLESGQMSLAAIFNAAGATPDIWSGIDTAGKVMSQMRKDAAELPGEFADLQRIVTTSAMSALQKGMSIDDIQKLGARAMAAGTAMGLNSHIVSRELAMLLEGRVGAHNILGTRMGISGAEADKFRGLDDQKKVEYLMAKFSKFDGAIKAFGGTWDAISSTAIDHWKLFLGTTSMPLFEQLKKAGQEFNAWFDQNQSKILGWATVVGSYLGEAFLEGKRVFQTYWPIFADFLEAAWHRTVAFFQEWYPEIKKVGAYLADAMKDSEGTLDKIETLLKLYIAAKAGGGLWGAGSSLLGPILSAGAKAGPAAFLQPMGSLLASGGGTAAAGAAAGEGAAAAGGMASLATSAAGAAAALGLLVAAGFATYEVTKLYQEHGAAVKEVTEIEWRTANMAARNMSEWDEVKKAGINSQMFNDAVSEANKQVSLFEEALYYAKLALFTPEQAGPSPEEANWDRFAAALQHVQYIEDQQKDQLAIANDALRQMTLVTAAQNQKKPEGKKKAPEGGNTFVTISMTVSSNQSPGQIARRAADMIVDGVAKGAASRRTANWSKRTHG